MKFQTSISREQNGELKIRGKALSALINGADYVGTMYLTVTGKDATPAQRKVLNAILVACIDHGVAPASGFVPRVVAASGNGVTQSLAAGVLALGPYHGAAIEDAMRAFAGLAGQTETDVKAFVTEMRTQKKRISGFGHKHYTTADPRTETLFALAKAEGIDGPAMAAARAVETALEAEMGRKLVLNIDGAVAALLLEIGLPPEAGNGIFALARMGGMLAHILEEKRQGTVVRRLDDEEIEFV